MQINRKALLVGCWCFNYFNLILKEFVTTDTELIAINNDASIGLNVCPVNGYKTPAATGRPIIL